MINEEDLIQKTNEVRNKIAQLQHEGEQLRKEVKDPKREFVEAMVARLEGGRTNKKPKVTPKKSSVPRPTSAKKIKPKPITSVLTETQQPTAYTFQIFTASSQATRSPWFVNMIISITLW